MMHQQDTNPELKIREYILPGKVKLRMSWVPSGGLVMGNAKGEKGRSSVALWPYATLKHGFWMSAFPITQAQWMALMGNNPSHFQGDHHPVEKIRWLDAHEMIDALNRAVKEPRGRFRLPTEAEWEYACRLGRLDSYAGKLDDIGWYANNSLKSTQPVGLKYPNEWGLYDMYGNVSEWCWDDDKAYRKGKDPDPSRLAGRAYRVTIGGSWRSEARFCRSATRGHADLDHTDNTIGFRIVRSVW